jgi:ribonuclease E
MTFYEAALRVLESAGRPLHVQEITEQSIVQNLLSHVGKAPDKTMLSRLAAMARRTRDRRVIVTARDTFALAEWAIPEDPEALAQTGVPELNPEESLPPLRQPERHPEARGDNVRAAGRPDRRRRHEEEDDFRGRRRRFPPVSELVFEILSAAGKPMKPEEIAQLGRERELASAELSKEQILTALLEDNQRRIDVGRRPQFVLSRETGELSLERMGVGETSGPEMQAAFAAVLGIPIEAGRPVPARAASVAPAEAADSGHAGVSIAVKESRRAIARELRRRLAELDIEAFHKAFVKVLQGLGFRELKVAKRSREGLLLTARKREGSIDLRFAIRLLRGTAAVDRRTVQDLRRDLGHYSAQVGLIASSGELRGDGRAEAQSSGSLTMVWCSEALGEKFIEAKAGVTSDHLEVFEVDDRFFAAAKLDAEEARRRRDERMRERQVRGERKPPEELEGKPTEQPSAGDSPPAGEQSLGAATAEAGMLEDPEADSSEGPAEDLAEEVAGEEGEETKTAAGEAGPPGAPPTDRKRRRRRRRGRRGRSKPPEMGPAAASNPGQTPAVEPAETPADQAPPGASTENEPQ